MAAGQIEFMMTPFVDSNGDPLDSGTVEFYIAGTSTPVTVFADKDEVTPLGTSVTLDSRGVKLCFADGDNFLKIVVKDSGGNTLYTYDGLSYRGGLTDANLYYLLDGTNALTGNMNVNGYNLNNTGDITVGTGKRLIIDHGGTYSPVATDMIVLQDPSAIYRNYTLSGNLYWLRSGVEKLRLENAAFYSLVDFDITGTLTVSGAGSIGGELNMNNNKITNLAAAVGVADAVRYDQLTASSGALQGELDATQTGAGLNTDGTYTPDATADYISAATSLKNADSLLDDQIKVNTDKGTSLQTELDDTQTGAGLNADGTYTTECIQYALGATSLNNADRLLETQISTNASDIQDLDTWKTGTVTPHIQSNLNPHSVTLSQAATLQGTTNWEQASGAGDATLPTIAGGSDVDFTTKVNILYDVLIKNNLAVKGKIGIHNASGAVVGNIANDGTDQYLAIQSKSSTICASFQNKRVLNIGTPVDPNDATSKTYVDTFVNEKSQIGQGGTGASNPPSTSASIALSNAPHFTLTGGYVWVIIFTADILYQNGSGSGSVLLKQNGATIQTINCYTERTGDSGHGYNHLVSRTGVASISVPTTLTGQAFTLESSGGALLCGGLMQLMVGNTI